MSYFFLSKQKIPEYKNDLFVIVLQLTIQIKEKKTYLCFEGKKYLLKGVNLLNSDFFSFFLGGGGWRGQRGVSFVSIISIYCKFLRG